MILVWCWYGEFGLRLGIGVSVNGWGRLCMAGSWEYERLYPERMDNVV